MHSSGMGIDAQVTAARGTRQKKKVCPDLCLCARDAIQNRASLIAGGTVVSWPSMGKGR